jgi:RNA polymerase subunit RPABC4/transcription elongation factor Spt4
MASYCTKCGSVLDPDAKFCTVCGSTVAAASLAATAVAAIPPERAVGASDRHARRPGMVVRRIAPMSAAKIQGTLMALLGLLFGLMFAAIGSVASMASQQSLSPLALMGAAFGVGAVIILPICYGIFGFISGLIQAGVYNLVAGFVGGIEIETG